MVSEHEVMIITSVIVVVLILIFAVWLTYTYRNGTGFFNYQQPPLANGWQPFGSVVTLTPQEIAARKNLFPSS